MDEQKPKPDERSWGEKNHELLQQLLTNSEKIMASIQDVIDDVAAESTVDDSIIALLNGISAQLAAALAAGGSPAQIQSIKDGLDANIAKIQAAITANTPPAPPAPAA